MTFATLQYVRHSSFRALGRVALCLGLLTWAGCDTVGTSGNSTDPGSQPVTVGFSVVDQASPSGVTKAASDEMLTIEGTNGTLRLHDVRLIVAEVKLKAEDDSTGEGPDFETPAAYLDLPFSATTIKPVADADIPVDTYDGFEFEVEDVDPTDDDLSAEQQAHLEALLDTIRTDYEDWPTDASMVAVGTFTPTGGDVLDFRTYFEAEIEIELDLEPALEVTADGLSRSITVRLDPAQWLKQADGTVVNLAESDYRRTEQLYELEAEFENGVAEIELGDG